MKMPFAVTAEGSALPPVEGLSRFLRSSEEPMKMFQVDCGAYRWTNKRGMALSARLLGFFDHLQLAVDSTGALPRLHLDKQLSFGIMVSGVGQRLPLPPDLLAEDS